MKKILLLTLCALAGLNAQAKPAAKAKAPAAKSAKPVLNFSLPQVKTDTLLTSAELSGTPVLIAVVSSGCGYCQRTLPLAGYKNNSRVCGRQPQTPVGFVK